MFSLAERGLVGGVARRSEAWELDNVLLGFSGLFAMSICVGRVSFANLLLSDSVV